MEGQIKSYGKNSLEQQSLWKPRVTCSVGDYTGVKGCQAYPDT